MSDCPHCLAGEPSIWDDVFQHFAHRSDDGTKLKFCHDPWRARGTCRGCGQHFTIDEDGTVHVHDHPMPAYASIGCPGSDYPPTSPGTE